MERRQDFEVWQARVLILLCLAEEGRFTLLPSIHINAAYIEQHNLVELDVEGLP